MTTRCRTLWFFYPRSPCGERRKIKDFVYLYNFIFYPRSPCGERPGCVFFLMYHFFYPSSPCGERPDCQRPCGRPTTIFYPRSPCGERQPVLSAVCATATFLSTLSLRRATAKMLYNNHTIHFFYPRSPCGERLNSRFLLRLFFLFYPRSPCGERPSSVKLSLSGSTFSIHALLAESDDTSGATYRILRAFLSTLSLRRATLLTDSFFIAQNLFYPRSPCGERRHFMSEDVSYNIFLSTLSLRRATWLRCWKLAARDFSIHALLAESDLATWQSNYVCGIFYPRSPCGERLSAALHWHQRTYFSIHALLAESDV